MKPLFALTTDILALDALENELGGELSPEVQAAWESMARELYEGEADKADAHVHWIRRLEGEASKARAEAEQYMQHATTRENRIKRIKELWRLHLLATNRTKLETSTGRVIGVQQNGGSLPVKLADAIDPATIPDEFAIVRRTPNVEAIREHLVAGGSLPFATLGERGNHLRIR